MLEFLTDFFINLPVTALRAGWIRLSALGRGGWRMRRDCALHFGAGYGAVFLDHRTLSRDGMVEAFSLSGYQTVLVKSGTNRGKARIFFTIQDVIPVTEMPACRVLNVKYPPASIAAMKTSK